MASPYERVLGDRFGTLDPRLRRYFSEIPAGSVGRGKGVFDVAGTRRPWLRGIVRAVSRVIGDDVAFPGWARDVAFAVTNRPRVGAATVAARRDFAFPTGPWSMIDEIRAIDRRDGSVELIDTLGAGRRLLAVFDVSIVGGGLQLRSRRVEARVGGWRMHIPNRIAPRVVLDETIGTDTRQHVAVEISLPLIGTLYEYRGSFDYRIVNDDAAALW